MRYRKLGNTGLTVSEISFGTIPILRRCRPKETYHFGQGPVFRRQ